MRFLHAWFDYRELRRVGKGIRAAPQATRTVPLALFKPWPGPVYAELGDFWTAYGNGGPMYRFGRCQACGAVVTADNSAGPIRSETHDNWHRRFC